ncbi:putative reverse transcriptase domain-containing protein [Tanacetum coccineum]
MAIELGSFDAIIGMDWLAKYQAIIVCAEKIVRIPWGNETLIVHGDGSNRGHEARLHIISYSKTQEYMLKGCLVFLAHVTTKEVEDKSEKKSKNEALEEIKTFLKKITSILQAQVIIVRIDNGIEFKNQALKEYFDSVGISHQASSVRTP